MKKVSVESVLPMRAGERFPIRRVNSVLTGGLNVLEDGECAGLRVGEVWTFVGATQPR